MRGLSASGRALRAGPLLPVLRRRVMWAGAAFKSLSGWGCRGSEVWLTLRKVGRAVEGYDRSERRRGGQTQQRSDVRRTGKMKSGTAQLKNPPKRRKSLLNATVTKFRLMFCRECQIEDCFKDVEWLGATPIGQLDIAAVETALFNAKMASDLALEEPSVLAVCLSLFSILSSGSHGAPPFLECCCSSPLSR
ncbi:hypothetical protein CCH79_00012239 [Gambusia affinis]|uniref:Uncharacterized protein n=1 Tax=Gambusia affinis TaxID=33528 RepID=A0A315UR52_GAMAF|nr:hypothetical protein CCH79_00012239 [Gambusia affinis]